MKLRLIMLILCGICFGQALPASLQEEHNSAIAKNPPDIELRIALAPSRNNRHDDLHLKLTFKSNKSRLYTAELAPGGNTATIDDFVFQGPGMPTPVHSKDGPPVGVVCCGSRRIYVGETPVTASAYFRIALPPRIRDPFAESAPSLTPVEPEPGDYSIFVQTRRVMKGWPKSERDRYFTTSDIILTSNNIVHITLLPDGTVEDAKEPPSTHTKK